MSDVAAGAARRPPSPVPSERTALEEQRDFLLRSLRDLDAEREAGDLVEADYIRLRDDYTVRAAAVIRALSGAERDSDAGTIVSTAPGVPASRVEGAAPGSQGGAAAATPSGPHAGPDALGGVAGQGAAAPGRPARRFAKRRALLAAIGMVVVVVAAVGALVASGVRLPGETITGEQAGTGGIDADLVAGNKAIAAGRPVAAMEDFQAVLDEDPQNPSALTGYGAVLVETHQLKLVARGVLMLASAESADASYGPAYAYLGEGLALLGDDSRAESQLRTFLAHDGSSPLAPSARKLLAAVEARQVAPRGSGRKP